MDANMLQRLQDFFFEAMLSGYASGAKPEDVPGMPGYKQFPLYKNGDLLLLDRWCVSRNSRHSFGTTAIWLDDEPIWVMSYGGWYDEVVIPFLQEALYDAYNQRKFVGCRGPEMFESGEFSYFNSWGPVEVGKLDTRDPNFGLFAGVEYITDAAFPNSRRGYHEYRGRALI